MILQVELVELVDTAPRGDVPLEQGTVLAPVSHVGLPHGEVTSDLACAQGGNGAIRADSGVHANGAARRPIRRWCHVRR